MSKIPTAEYIKAVQYRRTVYPLTGESPISDDRIVEVVQEILAVAPSSYNIQPMRVAIMLGAEHKKLWQIIRDESLPLLAGAGEQVVNMMKGRFDMFEAAYGSITFWDRTTTSTEAGQTHAAAAHMFPQWSEHANGMLQILVWTAVELEGLGANLQHMNMFPPAEAAIKKAFSLPDDWSLKANLNIGGMSTPQPERPAKLPFTETIKVFK